MRPPAGSVAPFLGSSPDRERAKVVLFGAPLDFTATFRPGARLAPRRVRELSQALEEHSFHLGVSLRERPFYDAGDVEPVWGNVALSLQAIRRLARAVIGEGKKPFVIGGEHLVTLAVLEELLLAYPDLVLVQLDAHADLRSDYGGEPLSHATVMRRAAELLGPGRLVQVGVRSAVPEEVEFARTHCLSLPRPGREAAERLREMAGGRPVYVSLDVDVLDPAFAPGTGTPEPGGATPEELFSFLYGLEGMRVVGFDLVEICPPFDPADITSLLGAKILREAILCLGGTS